MHLPTSKRVARSRWLLHAPAEWSGVGGRVDKHVARTRVRMVGGVPACARAAPWHGDGRDGKQSARPARHRDTGRHVAGGGRGASKGGEATNAAAADPKGKRLARFGAGWARRAYAPRRSAVQRVAQICAKVGGWARRELVQRNGGHISRRCHHNGKKAYNRYVI